MSRAALWKQEGKVKERERQADELYQEAVQEGRNKRSKGILPIWGPDDTFHFNPMLLQNTIKSPYFQKCCREILDWNALVDEIYYKVDNLEPWVSGSRNPSTAFCLLLRLLTIRCTEKQMSLLLDHVDSPYIRAIGFLYLRYSCEPNHVWKWIQNYIYDDELVRVEAKSAKAADGGEMTMGEYVRLVFSTRDYFGTMFPRYPPSIEQELEAQIAQAENIEDRAKVHERDRKAMDHFQRLGSNVMALYGDEENPLQWYKAIVDRVITTDPDTKRKLPHPKFVVTFPEYGNTETVFLGEMEMIGAPLIDPRELQQRKRRKAGPYGGNQGRRRHGQDNGSHGRDPSRRAWDRDRSSDYRNPPARRGGGPFGERPSASSSRPPSGVAPPEKRPRRDDPEAAEKRRRLMAKYG